MRGNNRASFWSFHGLLLVAVVFCGALAATSLAGEFETANQRYDEAKFEEAKQDYQKLLQAGEGSPNIFYDLGNCEFRLGSAGRAMLDYERALSLDPRHPEAQANLKLLRDHAGSKLLPATWSRRLARELAPNTWSIIAAVAGWGALFGLAWLCIQRTGLFSGTGVFTAVCAVICAGAVAAVVKLSSEHLGIVTAAETQARLAPAESAGIAESLPAGSQVRVLSVRGAWVYCEMPNAIRGWVPVDAMETVRPAKS